MTEHTRPEIVVGPTWFVLAVVGVAMNFAGSWVWFGVGPALFITGALTVVLVWASIAMFVWASMRTLAARRAAETGGRASKKSGQSQ